MSLFVKQNSRGGIIINDNPENINNSITRNDIIIDGYNYSACLRVQSHFHSDHTVDLFKSKLDHDILLSEATRSILGREKDNQDIDIRPGIIGYDYATIYKKNQYEITLLNNGHVLGSSQVEVKSSNYSVGYSGDFYDPHTFFNVNHLIIDGSVGGLFKIRKFTREDSINALKELLIKITMTSHVVITAHSGLLEKIYFWIADLMPNLPRIADSKFIHSINTHADYGYGIVSNIFDKDDKIDGFAVLRSKETYIRFKRQTEDVFDIENQTVINCSRFQDIHNKPLVEQSSRSFIISMSDHADIISTLDYVKNVDPEFISIDFVRMRNPTKSNELLNYISNELKIKPIKLEIIPDERF